MKSKRVLTCKTALEFFRGRDTEEALVASEYSAKSIETSPRTLALEDPYITPQNRIRYSKIINNIR